MSKMGFSSIKLLLVSKFASTVFGAYVLSQNYTGANFYDGFKFFTGTDPTQGHVQYLSLSEANETQLAGLLDGGNASMAVYLGVDSESEAPNGRGSVRVESVQAFNHGLFITDIAHMPGGICGTWPAFWMTGPDWPNDGEIDIIEGVNDMTTNSMALHTAASLVMQNTTIGISGTMHSDNCGINTVGQAMNVGCGVMAESELTFGAGFNAAGGGVYATEWTSDFFKIWFFPRGSIPEDIMAAAPSPSDAWGQPDSFFQSGSSIDQYFQNMYIIFDTTFCGQWAGKVWEASRCAQLAPTCEEYVTSNPQAFKDAYWAINTLQVFQNNSSSTGASTEQDVEWQDEFQGDGSSAGAGETQAEEWQSEFHDGSNPDESATQSKQWQGEFQVDRSGAEIGEPQAEEWRSKFEECSSDEAKTTQPEEWQSEFQDGSSAEAGES